MGVGLPSSTQTKFNTTAFVTAEKIGKDGKAVQGTQAGVNLKFSQVVTGMEYFISGTEVSLPKAKRLEGLLFGIKKKWGDRWENLTSTATYDFNTKHKTLKLEGVKNFGKGRALEPLVYWRERDDEVLMELTGKLDSTKKVTIRQATGRKQMTTANASLSRGTWELKPSYNFTKQDGMVALTKRSGADKFTAVVQPRTQEGMLEWQRKLLTLAVKAPLSQPSHPTVILKVERDFERYKRSQGNYGTGPSMTQTSASAKPGSLLELEQQRQGPLDKRLRDIDRLHAQKEKEQTTLQEEAHASKPRKKKFGIF